MADKSDFLNLDSYLRIVFFPKRVLARNILRVVCVINIPDMCHKYPKYVYYVYCYLFLCCMYVSTLQHVYCRSTLHVNYIDCDTASV